MLVVEFQLDHRANIIYFLTGLSCFGAPEVAGGQPLAKEEEKNRWCIKEGVQRAQL